MVIKKREDTAEGCRGLAKDDQERATGAASALMRRTLRCSAEAWASRAKLLERLEAEFRARAVGASNTVNKAPKGNLAIPSRPNIERTADAN